MVVHLSVDLKYSTLLLKYTVLIAKCYISETFITVHQNASRGSPVVRTSAPRVFNQGLFLSCV